MALRHTQTLHQNRGNRLQAAPAAEPITAAELKTHLRITGTDEDTYITSLIGEARQEIEDITGLAFITQEWKLTLDHWPMAGEKWWDGEVEAHVNTIYEGARSAAVTLPRYPLLTVDTVTVYDESGTSSAVTISDVFDIDVSFLRGRLTRKRGAVWPVALRSSAAIEIEYTSGYGAAATAIPAPLKRAVRQMAAYMYSHRGDDCTPLDAYKASGAADILDRYRSIEV